MTGENVDQQEFSFIADGNANVAAILEDSLTVSYKIKHIFVPCNLAIMFIGNYPKKLKTDVHRKLARECS